MTGKPAIVPAGYHTVTPWIIAKGAGGLVSFIEKTFGGKEKEGCRILNADGLIDHGEVQLEDACGAEGSHLPAGGTKLSGAQANDPVVTSPARWYEAMITPRGEVLHSSNLNAFGIVPSANRRFPGPSVRGNIFSHNSSTRSCFRSVWTRFPLP